MKKLIVSTFLGCIGFMSVVNAQQVIGINGTGGSVLKGSDVNKSSNLMRPGDITHNGAGGNSGIIKVEAPEVITKKDYEEGLKKRGVTQEQDLKRVQDNRLKVDGIIDDVEYIKNGDSISTYEQQKKQIEKEFDELKKSSKIQGNDKEYFESFALSTIKKSEDVLFSVEKDLYTRKVVLGLYEKAERQIQLLNMVVEANYSVNVSKKAELVKTRAYILMRQMFPFILQDSLKGSSVNALSADFKLLKVVTPGMNANEVIKLKYITENAFAIGFEKVIYTNNNQYAVEEDVKEYIKKIKEEKFKNK